MTETKALASKIVSLIDLTSLNTSDTADVIRDLCTRSLTPIGPTAAVCVYKEHVKTARQTLDERGNKVTQVATVVNFPEAKGSVAEVVSETEWAIEQGADEIDLVYPYHLAMEGDFESGIEMVKAVKKTCSSKALLKVILETGELKDPELIAKASDDALIAGADFVKTSTGKVDINATLEAAELMLKSIKKSSPQAGFKAAGGIRTLEQAQQYIEQAEQIMGNGWVESKVFRFGASGLLDDVLSHAGVATSQAGTSGY